MVRNNGSVSLAFLRGERRIDPNKSRSKTKCFYELSDKEEREVREEAFKTGETFSQVLKRKEANQTNLEFFKNNKNKSEVD